MTLPVLVGNIRNRVPYDDDMMTNGQAARHLRSMAMTLP
jgi:hypothetical protein